MKTKILADFQICISVPLSLEFKVANVIKIKKKQVLLELHNRSRKIILIC